MRNQRLAIKASGIAAATVAHALFFLTLIAGQPAPAHYLAQLAPPPGLLAARGVQPAAAAQQVTQQLTVVQTASPERLNKGSITC